MGDNASMNEDASSAVKTHFAPPERADPSNLDEMMRAASESPLLQAIQESIDGFLMILNPQRQVLAVNKDMLTTLGLETPECLVGNRPGEVLGCIHASEGPGGCGTSRACSTCGAVIAILTSQEKGEPVEGECLATVKANGGSDSFEFRVRSTPVKVGPHDFTVFVLNDISGDKRREALERAFFHDIMNTIGGLIGWSDLFQRIEGLDPKEVAAHILALSNRLRREVEDQRRLYQAEKGNLELVLETVPVTKILEAIEPIFSEHSVAKEKTLEIQHADPEVMITTDTSLVVRVLTNMVKNALEAIERGKTVRLWHEAKSDQIIFCVQNPGVIPDDVALRIFKRSFSTKGQPGRGIGTYSMKLFGERYLGGKVDFESKEYAGTVFSIALPANGPAD